jgi:hypothetical protein
VKQREAHRAYSEHFLQVAVLNFDTEKSIGSPHSKLRIFPARCGFKNSDSGKDGTSTEQSPNFSCKVRLQILAPGKTGTPDGKKYSDNLSHLLVCVDHIYFLTFLWV